MAQGHQSFLLKEAVPHSAERYAAVGQQRAGYGQHYGSWEPSLMLIVCLLPPPPLPVYDYRLFAYSATYAYALWGICRFIMERAVPPPR